METPEKVPSFFDAKELEDWNLVRGWKTGEIAEAFYRYVGNLQVAGAVVELGSYAGKTTICIARALKDHHNGQQKVVAIDASFQEEFISNLRRFGVDAFVKPINATITQAAESWNETIAFLYYDVFTDQQALTDFQVWDKWIALGGTVALDNTAGFWVGSGLQAQAAIRSGAYSFLEDVCGVTLLRKETALAENIGEVLLGEAKLRAHLDFASAWTGAFTLELEPPRAPSNYPQSVSQRMRRFLVKGWRKVCRLRRSSSPALDTTPLSEASQILSRLNRQVSPDSTEAYTVAYLKACLAFEQGRLSNAISMYTRLSCLPPDSKFVNYRLGIRETALLRLGQAYDLRGDRAKAQSTYRELLDMAETVEIAGAAKRWIDEPFKRAEPVLGKLLREYVANDPLGPYRSSFSRDRRSLGTTMFSHSCLVVAHPDDEILWFSSILSRVDRIIICFLGNPAVPDRGPSRSRVLDRYPMNNIECLELDVPLTEIWCNWSNPIVSEFGLQLPEAAQSRYEHSFMILQTRLRKELSGCDNVITHNPWGEYGHEMHVQVHTVVESLSGELGYHLWFSNYVSAQSSALAERYMHGPFPEPVCFGTDIDLAHRVRNLYIAEGCWTAPIDYVWSERECFNRMPTKEERMSNRKRRIFSVNHV